MPVIASDADKTGEQLQNQETNEKIEETIEMDLNLPTNSTSFSKTKEKPDVELLTDPVQKTTKMAAGQIETEKDANDDVMPGATASPEGNLAITLAEKWQLFLVAFLVSILFLPVVYCSCPFQCTCMFHSLTATTKTRSVLCNDPEMSLVPVNVPIDTTKLRIEKTAIRKISSEAFHYLSNLELLLLSYNSLTNLNSASFKGLKKVHDLRLDGNNLSLFPWEALAEMPKLRLLDLHNNKISFVPAEAKQYIRNLIYLDLSSNKLITLPNELVAVWLSVPSTQDAFNANLKIILGLQDNPWLCDCRLYELVHFLNHQTSSVAFIEPKLKCFAPESLSGVFFDEAEIRMCQSPAVYTSVTTVKTSVGSTVLMRCGTTGVPIPEVTWRRADGHPLNGTIQQEISSNGMKWSFLSLPVVSYRDSGDYICKAENLHGVSDAFISLVVTDDTTEKTNQITTKTAWSKRKKGIGAAAYNEKLIARYVIPGSTTSLPDIQPLNIYTEKDPGLENYRIPDTEESSDSNLKIVLDYNSSKSPGNLVSNPSFNQPEAEHLVRSVKVIGDNDHSVSLAWKAPQAKNTTIFNILYAVFGERDMRKISVEPGKTKTTIVGLKPQTKYIACVCVKGLIPKKEQCIIFSTDEAVSAGGTQKLINVVVISVACVIALPLTLIVCCGALKRRCSKFLGKETKDIQDSYVTFESLSPTNRAKGVEGEYFTRHTPDESNRLLSPRSSLDSEATIKTDGQNNEFFC
ncbi:leucine-rich repeat, immunoglobulin-like domain and transmembrane domain-containing protein 1a [Latimeria chalumnae]|uniref:leucine-rich repeat, immunoglobulin-like domain and transmembrane domain-containing protein 1a n=1 Tax=Latimeria chalumnae TaxID=7897 RepID=UPI00313B2FFF